jgi:hypothetical protein
MRARAVLLLIAASCSGGEDATGGVGPEAGPKGPKPPGAACNEDTECESTCTAGRCALPTITDKKLSPSLGETDVDTGPLPNVALVGYSFEGHSRRSEAYLASTTEDESKLVAGDIKPVTFPYGKVGGRCARF